MFHLGYQHRTIEDNFDYWISQFFRTVFGGDLRDVEGGKPDSMQRVGSIYIYPVWVCTGLK
jgi:hypothetical protein